MLPRFLIPLCLSVVCLLVVSPGHGDEIRRVTASASGEVEAVPDIAVVQGRVVVQRSAAEAAVKAAQKRLDEVLRYLAREGVGRDDIRAAQVLVDARWHYPRNQPRELQGYEARADITIRLRDVARLGALYSGLIEAGASELQPTRFEFSKRQALELEAIAAAVDNARAKARAALQPLDADLGKVQSLNIDTHWQVPPRQERAVMMSAARDGGEAQVSIGKHTVAATVSASFEIR